MPAFSFVRILEGIMSVRSRIAQQAFDLALPVVEEMGLELVDSEYKKEGSRTYLRLFIDKKGGVSMDDCEAVSRAMDPVFDRDLHADTDFFEVSSPGLTRPLVTPSDFRRHEGEEVEVSFYRPFNGAKHLTCVIHSALDEAVELLTGEESIEVPYKEIASAKLSIKF